MRILMTAAFAVVWPAIGLAQDMAYTQQFGVGVRAMAADETGTYLLVDVSTEAPPNRSIELRRLENTTGSVVWTQPVYSHTSEPAKHWMALAVDANGVYVGYSPGLTAPPMMQRHPKTGGAPVWSAQLQDGGDMPNAQVRAVAVEGGKVHMMLYLPPAGGVTYANSLYSWNLDGTGLSWVSLSRAMQPVLATGSAGFYSAGLAVPPTTAPAVTRYGYNTQGVIALAWWHLLPDNVTVRAMLAHPTGLYVAGSILTHSSGVSTESSVIFRYPLDQAAGENTHVPAPLVVIPPGTAGVSGGVRIKSLTADAAGLIAAGEFSGQIAGEAATGSRSTFVQKYDLATGVVQWTRTFGGPTGETTPVAAVAVQGGVQVAGFTQSALPGQPPLATPVAGFLVRLGEPAPTQQSVSALLNQLSFPGVNGLRGSLGAACNQLSGIVRDVQRNRGSRIPVAQADALLSRIGDAQMVLGCAQ